MSEIRKILAIAPNLGIFRSLESMLAGAGVGVHRAPSGAGGLILLGNRRYDLVLVEAPLPDLPLESLLSSIRSLDSMCGNCPVMLLSPKEEVRALTRRFRASVASVVSKTAAEKQLQKALSRLLGLSSRTGARLLVEVTAEPQNGPSARLFQTHNLSQSGVLLRASDLPPVGTRLRLSFSLPTGSQPISCEGEVVRHTDPAKEGLQGFAVQFLGLRDEERERLRGFVEVDLSVDEAEQVAAVS